MGVDVRLSARAQAQLADLMASIAQESPTGARRLRGALGQLLDRIGEYPESCPAVGGDPTLRMGLAARRLHLLYQIRDDGLLVLDVVYAGYDLRKLFDE
ncbi:type II toxin-antitoxin system RelE/ParE family toxin [Brevundimonas sp. SL130]|uniref:type II toxin-antitoxin system RelE/ParE family toxin n=1 Tax=Brevundimonas sp. SL130 TaxID=2995143 RepID=UPI00226CE024|nr:type II toxin-antitoxin system RelE/ParE family toxin [Brevundimonas sp. SL130]WAC60239.1 type II toxin-antitoxin system RelE/ParE family toxin [Brevundimonas sp. SL130]